MEISLIDSLGMVIKKVNVSNNVDNIIRDLCEKNEFFRYNLIRFENIIFVLEEQQNTDLSKSRLIITSSRNIAEEYLNFEDRYEAEEYIEEKGLEIQDIMFSDQVLVAKKPENDIYDVICIKDNKVVFKGKSEGRIDNFINNKCSELNWTNHFEEMDHENLKVRINFEEVFNDDNSNYNQDIDEIDEVEEDIDGRIEITGDFCFGTINGITTITLINGAKYEVINLK